MVKGRQLQFPVCVSLGGARWRGRVCGNS